MADDKSKPVIDELGYAGPWGDAKPGDVAPGFSKDPAQRQRDLEIAEQNQLQIDLIGNQIAKISAQLEQARLAGDEARYKELRAEQRRLTRLQLSIG